MKTEELIDKYDCLYDKMKHSKDVKHMKVFGKSEKYIFHELAKVHPDMAEKWVAHIEAGLEWNNFLTQNEAMNIGKRITNQDGTKGFHWNHETFVNAVKSLGGIVENKPHYNSYALCVTANMVYSDHALSIADDMGYKTLAEVPNERMALSCYKKAVEMLEDPDGGFSVRDYFRHKMYDNSPM